MALIPLIGFREMLLVYGREVVDREADRLYTFHANGVSVSRSGSRIEFSIDSAVKILNSMKLDTTEKDRIRKASGLRCLPYVCEECGRELRKASEVCTQELAELHLLCTSCQYPGRF